MLSTQNPPSSSSSDPPPPSLLTTNEIHHKLDPSSSNFSIRDYVFSARSKDIKKNWPFSLKNLQLCLKHGLNNPLPPFQHLPVAAVVLDSCNNHTSSRSGEENQNQNENDFPSTTTTTSVSQSEIESVLVNKPSITASVVAQAVVPLRSRKSENTARSSGKKCKLIVKFGANSPTEDIGSNSSMVSESMASKVCPVCKTFSSSSNTTLNAHIDQCLSGEPPTTSKWMPDYSKLTTTRQQHNTTRIKPRKTRMMVDIYTTAKHCTLEELDKRNGTNWATMSTMPVSNDDLEVSDQGKKRTRAPFVNREGDGAVYIDASGTKVRILSKLNEESSVLKDIAVPKKTLKGNKFFSNKKKRLDVLKKRLKHLKHASTQRSKVSPRKVHALKIVDEEEEYRTPEGSFKDMERNGIQSTCSGSSSEKRACSKRSGPPRKAKFQDSYQPLLSGWRVNKDSPANGEHAVKKHGVDKLKDLSETSFSAPEGTSKGENSPGRKRVRSPLIGEKSSNKLSKGGHFMHENSPSSFSNKRTGIDATSDPDFHPGNSFGVPSKARSKKSLLSVNRKLPVVDSPTKKKRQLHFLAEERQDDETMEGPESLYGDPEEGEDMDSSVREDDNDDIREKGDSFESVEEIDACPSTSAEPSDPSRSISLQAVDEYSRPYCGDGALPATIESSFIDRQEIFSGDEVGPDPVGNADGKTDLMDDSFPEVDPIPIPGPPGSFLPSPRDMSSDDFPGNSSLTTSRVQSSQDQLELVDGDCSESPLSAASTISNPSSARFDLRYSESFGPPTVDNKSIFSSSSKAEPRVEDAVQTSQIAAEKSGVVRRSLVEKRPPFNFRNVDQPCCCQRKEKSSSQTSISMLDYQQSPLLIKRRAMTSGEMPSGEMLHIGGTRPGAFSSRSLGGPENVVVQEIRPPPIVVKEKGRFDGGGANSPSSTTTSNNNHHNNPVLRLMGKNLMVVNKEKEELSSHLSRSGSVQSEGYGPFHGRVVVEDSSSFGQQHNNSSRYLYHHPGPGAGAVVVKGEILPGAVFLQEEQCMEQEEAYYYNNNNYISPSTAAAARREKAHKAKLHGLEQQQQVVVVLDDDEVGAMPQQQYKASRHVENNANMSCYYGVGPSYSQEQEQPRHFPFPSGGGSGNEAQAGSPLIRPNLSSRWGGVSGQSSPSMYYYYSPHT